MASLLSNGANVNAIDEDGRTSLHIACWNANVSCVQILLSHGAKINIFDKEKLAAPLFCVVASGSGPESEAVVDLLMKNGADVNLGLSPIFIYLSTYIENVGKILADLPKSNFWFRPRKYTLSTYSNLPNKRATRLLISLKKSSLHALIRIIFT